MTPIHSLSLAFLCALTLSSLTQCSEYNQVLKSDDMQLKMDYASAALDSGNCFKALPLFDELMRLTRGTEQAPEVHWQRALTHDCVNDFYLSRYYFQTFAKTFPNDPRVEEAMFRAALCSYYLSPEASLDQTDTKSAMDELQLFMDRYPSSALRDSSQSMVDALRLKLELKAFENAKLYHKTGNYESATLAMKHAIDDYPGSPYTEELYYLIIDSHFRYASLSTERRKFERYNNAIQAFHTFASRYPESNRMGQAQKLYDASVQAIAELEETENNTQTNR